MSLKEVENSLLTTKYKKHRADKGCREFVAFNKLLDGGH